MSDASETKTPNSGRMPALFMGHGSPMNAIEDNAWSRAFRELGTTLPKPKAIVCVSAHWYVAGTYVTDDEHPKTIHDFGGFPKALHDVQYPAAGDPELAAHVVETIGKSAARSREWGLDHGTWSVLCHLFPNADVPVLQVSIDHRLAPADHVVLGRKLRSLRDEGVLVMGSGNITHNLRDAFAHLGDPNAKTPEWAARFDSEIASALSRHDHDFIARNLTTPHGRMSHPTLDHYLPLLYAAGASTDEDDVSFPITGFDAGSLSMRAVLWT